MARPSIGQVIVERRQQGRTFAIRYTVNGRRIREKLGSAAEGWTKRKAEAELKRTLAAVELGVWQPRKRQAEAESEPERVTFREFANEWFDRGRHEWSARTRDDYLWAVRDHLMPFFAWHSLDEITVAEVDRYRAAKQAEGKLSANSINKTLTRLSQVLERAAEYELIASNPLRANPRKRRCKPTTPGRASMGAEQVAALLQCAGRNRALLATAIMAGGLRVGEVTGLRWRDVDLARGRLRVSASKTAAGVRLVVLDPNLREQLTEHKAKARDTTPDAYVFPGRNGKRRDRNAVRRSVLYPAIERANAILKARNMPLIPDGSDGEPRVTFHSLRRTYASLCAEANADPAWTSRQIGHKSARFTIDVYTDVENRRESPAEQVGALVWGSFGSLPKLDDPSTESAETDSALESA